MDNFAKIMSSWEQTLNADAELQERNKSMYSTLEGKTAIQLEVGTLSPYIVELKQGRFKVQQGTAKTALLCWKIPLSVFKEVMLGKRRLIFSILDPQGELSFDTSNFSHWNGATVIEMLLLACEMTASNQDMLQLVATLEC